MNTRIIICGSRDFCDKELCFKALDEILEEFDNPEIVSGHAKGADTFGEEYAMEGTPVIIAFWDGKSKGTKNMIDQARKVNAKVYIVTY